MVGLYDAKTGEKKGEKPCSWCLPARMALAKLDGETRWLGFLRPTLTISLPPQLSSLPRKDGGGAEGK
jgi:hypothetical protein